MSNGSRGSLEESRRGQVLRFSRMFGLLVASFAGMATGCHHVTLHQGPDLQAELTTVAAEDLFFLGVSHARSGDLLRAEQYLSAARQRGHDEAATVYWLVRVCVAASRYQSALAHAADYLRSHPTHWSLRLVVASIYEALGDVTRAQSELERIVRDAPERPLPHYRLAMLYRSKEADRERTKAHLEGYLRLNPHGVHASEARSILAEFSSVSMGPQLVPHPSHDNSTMEQAP